MALHTSSVAVLLTALFLPLLIPNFYAFGNLLASTAPAQKSEVDSVQFILNFEFLVVEYFLYGTTGRGLDGIAPELAQGGPPPIGGQLATLDPLVKDVMLQFGLQDVGHIRAIERAAKGFPRPLLNISKGIFAQIVDKAFGRRLQPPFDPYANTINYVLGAYAIGYVTPAADVAISPKLQNPMFKKLVAGLLGVNAGQYAAIRSYLYERRNMTVTPYRFTVTEFTNRLSELANKFGKEGTISEGIVVPPSEGAEGKVSGNLIPADKDSLFFEISPEEILRIAYGSGDEHVPGAFFPKGANGLIAKSFLNRAA